MPQLRLTDEQKEFFKKNMVPFKEATPVRFMKDGRATNPITGFQNEKGINVIYQRVYWNFKRETAKEIAALIGARCEFSE